MSSPGTWTSLDTMAELPESQATIRPVHCLLSTSLFVLTSTPRDRQLFTPSRLFSRQCSIKSLSISFWVKQSDKDPSCGIQGQCWAVRLSQSHKILTNIMLWINLQNNPGHYRSETNNYTERFLFNIIFLTYVNQLYEKTELLKSFLEEFVRHRQGLTGDEKIFRINREIFEYYNEKAICHYFKYKTSCCQPVAGVFCIRGSLKTTGNMLRSWRSL